MEVEAKTFNLVLHGLRQIDKEYDMYLRKSWERKRMVSDILRNSPGWTKFVENI